MTGKLQPIPPLETTPARVMAALFAGAGVGSGICSGTALIATAPAFASASQFAESVTAAVAFVPVIWLFSAVIYLAGLVFVGGPLWALLHDLGRRDMFTAALLGAALNVASVSLLTSFALGAWFAIPGALVGLTVWRVGYARSDPQ